MAIQLTSSEIQTRFSPDTVVFVSYQNKKKQVRTKLNRVNWNERPVAMTLMFKKPKSYLIDGDEAIRPGVRVRIIKDKASNNG